MNKQKTCYMCNNIATSREHIPPICLFPESKDVSGLNFRKDLITVPSCDTHNANKTKDDEFLMISIAGIIGNNYLGFYHTKTKINRALRRKSKSFLYKIINNPVEGDIHSSTGKRYPVLYGAPDFKRLIKCFESIAYGLYFNEYNLLFEGKVKILMGFIDYKDVNHNTMVKFVKKRFEIENLALPIQGTNPNIFTYQFCKPDEHGLIALKLTFYRGTEIFISLVPKNKEIPFDLSSKFIQSGMHTILTIDNIDFEFNKK